MSRVVYLAGSSQEAALIGSYAAVLQAAGYEIAFPWWTSVIAERARGITGDRDLTTYERINLAADESKAASQSDLFWFLLPEPPNTTRGAWFEFATARAAGVKTVVSGDVMSSIFCERAARKYATHAEALSAIVGWFK